MTLIKWDTDGQRLVVELQLEDTNEWAKYPGIQIYWKNLPQEI